MLLIHSVKNQEIHSLQKIFREINSSISSVVPTVVKPMVSRNFCQKSVSVNFHNIHTVLPKALSILDE